MLGHIPTQAPNPKTEGWEKGKGASRREAMSDKPTATLTCHLLRDRKSFRWSVLTSAPFACVCKPGDRASTKAFLFPAPPKLVQGKAVKGVVAGATRSMGSWGHTRASVCAPCMETVSSVPASELILGFTLYTGLLVAWS